MSVLMKLVRSIRLMRSVGRVTLDDACWWGW